MWMWAPAIATGNGGKHLIRASSSERRISVASFSPPNLLKEVLGGRLFAGRLSYKVINGDNAGFFFPTNWCGHGFRWRSRVDQI